MKGIKLLFAVCLAPLVFRAATADDASEIARAATRRNPTNTVSAPRKSGPTDTKIHTTSATASRTTNLDTPNTNARNRGTATTVSRTPATPGTDKRVTARTATTTIQPRIIKTTERAATRTATTPARTAIGDTLRTRTATPTTRARSSSPATRARSATTTTADTIMSRDFSKCRSVFYDCMDEFCANKDSQLKRCACSTRVNEFEGTKKNLAQVEDKLLDFSQRLLTVSMDAEDAAALNTATAGEEAFYNTKDTSASKKMLDEIAKKLNTSFNDSNFDQNLNAISLSLNTDAAFDSVDSLRGASTTAKTGTALHAAALPVCREMAAEVCTPDDLAIAESGYQMAIEHDCDTVYKSYKTQAEQARTKVFESGALLDMSRLDVYQQRNSDNILTCKSKMLDMLTDSTVCGENLGKCLDTSGRYIDPTTGQAFLTADLANLTTLITRPESGRSWTTVPGNDRFVSFLNSKKIFLEPAMEHCQDISDYVWDAFIEDALSQIKLAQDKKLEEVRQSCTTLTTQCLDTTADSITKFDARALSIFGIEADKTVNAICADVQNACTALLESTGGGGTDWVGGMTEIATEKTYETILQTCREVGRACIIQACTSISGNFGLCENIDTSINRKSIINRTACWDEVYNCVASAGAESIAHIMKDRPSDPDSGDLYSTLYNQNTFTRTPAGSTLATTADDTTDDTTDDTQTSATVLNPIYDLCRVELCETDENGNTITECSTNDIKWQTCRLAEQIWGNCEYKPTKQLSETDDQNKILINSNNPDNETLLSWFARNTGTADKIDSCRDTSCGPGFRSVNGVCIPSEKVTADGKNCLAHTTIHITSTITNCCETDITTAKNCCINGKNYTVKTTNFDAASVNDFQMCAPSTPTHVLTTTINGTKYSLVCLGQISGTDVSDTYPNGTTIHCDGHYVLVTSNGKHVTPQYDGDTSVTTVQTYYNETADNVCTYQYDGSWSASNGSAKCATPDLWMIEYPTTE